MPLHYRLSGWRARDASDSLPGAALMLCFGDSWLSYPDPSTNNLAVNFADLAHFATLDVVVLGRPGLEIGDRNKVDMKELATFLSWEGQRLGAIVVSGGGNDVAGMDDLLPMLQVGSPLDAASWFLPGALQGLQQRVRTGYERVLELRNSHCPDVPVLGHCYDYAHASGQGVLWLDAWIKPAFDQIGMPTSLRLAAIRLVIDALAEVQTALSASHPNYHFVDTRGVLTAGDWRNELHPTRMGFRRVAQVFQPRLRQLMPATFP